MLPHDFVPLVDLSKAAAMDKQEATCKFLDTLLGRWHQRNGKPVADESEVLSDTTYSPFFDVF